MILITKTSDQTRRVCVVFLRTKNVFVVFLSGVSAGYFQHAHFVPIVGVGKRGEY